MEHNLTKEQIVQMMIDIQANNMANQADDISMAVLIAYFAMWAFASIGAYVTVRFIYRFIKNGFKIKKELVVTKYVYVDSYMGMAFFLFIASVIVLAIGKAYAVGAIRL
jgi:hypothetical protein